MIRKAAFLFLPLLVIGCNNSGSENPQGSYRGTNGGAGHALKLVYIPKNSGNTYFDEVNRGFEDAAKKFNLEFTTVAPAKADATSQIPIIKDQIQRGVNIIAISANSPDALNPVLDQARSRGITVITVDSDLVGNESHRDAAVLPADFAQIGPSQIDLLGKLMGFQGKFAILSATTDAPNQNAWIEKMKEALKDPRYAKMELVEVAYGDDEPQKSTTECEALLAKYPDLAGIVSPTSVGLAASAQVLERSGKKVKLTGLSTPNQLKKFVGNGTVLAFQLWSPRDMGTIAAYIGQQIHVKGLTPKDGVSFDMPGMGKRAFTSKLEVVAGPLVTFDKTNIDKYDF